MITLSQLVKYGRSRKSRTSQTNALDGAPMRKGTVQRVFEQSPKKPNSAKRKVAKVKLAVNERQVICHIPGEGHNLSKHSTVMVRGGRCQDLIGVHFKPIRGLFSLEPLHKRVTRLSKYGVKTKKK
jgi:small subunit ribosomal protein S12